MPVREYENDLILTYVPRDGGTENSTEFITIRELTLIFNDILAYITSNQASDYYSEIWTQLRFSLGKLSYREVNELQAIADFAKNNYDHSKTTYEI